MIGRYTGLLLFVTGFAACSTSEPVADDADGTYRLALVALVANPESRIEFEDGLAAKLRAHKYDAVASHTLLPDVAGLDGLVPKLAGAGVQGIVMMRPAAVGPGASLESVKDEIPADMYNDMSAFAREISPTQSDDVVAVVHTAFYMIKGHDSELLSSGAVWLDQPVATREEGIDKLQDLIVANMNRARPAAREYLGLPPIQ